MRNRKLIRYIPVYPKGVSEEYLAICTGYMKPPYTDKRIEKGLKALRHDIDILTIRHADLIEQTVRLQVSTESHLRKEGFPIEDRMYTYYSRLA